MSSHGSHEGPFGPETPRTSISLSDVGDTTEHSLQLDSTCTSQSEDMSDELLRLHFQGDKLGSNSCSLVLPMQAINIEHIRRERRWGASREVLRQAERLSGENRSHVRVPAGQDGENWCQNIECGNRHMQAEGNFENLSEYVLGEGSGRRLPYIHENEQEPVHSRESLCSILAHYNTLDCDGQIGGSFVAGPGVAYANVPNTSLTFTTRPWTAIWSRWQFSIFVFTLAAALLQSGFSDLHHMTSSSTSRSMRWLKVENIEVFENVFPNFTGPHEIAENRRLALVDVGIYLDSYNCRLTEACNTTITSASSFEIACHRTVEMHGIWVLVAGATERASADAAEGLPLPYYEYAGIQYSYTIGEDDSVFGRRTPDETDVYNVMGTGQFVRGKIWDVLKSGSSSEGIFRIPTTARLPLVMRAWKEIVDFVAYTLVGLVLAFASVLGLAGR